MFPDEDDNLTNYVGGSAQVMVPNGLLQAIGKCIQLCMHKNFLHQLLTNCEEIKVRVTALHVEAMYS